MSDRDDSKPEATPPTGPESASAGGEEKPAETPAADEKAAAPGEQAPAAEEKAPAAGEKAAAADEGGGPPEAPAPEQKSAEEEAAEKAAAAAAAKAKAEAAAKAKAAAEAAKPPWERDPVPPQWEEAGDDPLAASIAAAHGGALASARVSAGDLVLEIEPAALAEVAADLKENHGYRLLVDICGAHYPKREEHPFEVIYQLYSFDDNRRLRLRVRTGEQQPVPSLVGVWRGANWPEREVWDMYGIRFEGHPDMTRILMWEGFNGHPLRKEFPVEGVDTGAAIYPEYYDEEAGPVTGTGTGWKPPEPPAEEAEEAPEEPS